MASHHALGVLAGLEDDGHSQGSREARQGQGGTRAARPASSLVPISESVDGNGPEIAVERPLVPCPKRPLWVVCDQDPSVRYAASCDAYRCSVCGPRKALQAASLGAYGIRHADRGRFVTLTQAPEDWQQRRQKMRDLRRLLARRGFQWECAWATEKGSRTGMVHVHGLQHGSYVPQRVLQEVWVARVDIRKVQTGGVARYVTKEALKVAGYTVKAGTASTTVDGMHDFLDLNGGRPMHWTRGYLHGLSKREALQALRRELATTEGELTWHLEPVI